jgi:hypothetical protein
MPVRCSARNYRYIPQGMDLRSCSLWNARSDIGRSNETTTTGTAHAEHPFGAYDVTGESNGILTSSSTTTIFSVRRLCFNIHPTHGTTRNPPCQLPVLLSTTSRSTLRQRLVQRIVDRTIPTPFHLAFPTLLSATLNCILHSICKK